MLPSFAARLASLPVVATICLLPILSLVHVHAVEPSDTDPVALASQQWQKTGWPLLQTYCVDCHNADNAEAEIDLTLLQTLDGVREHGDLANKVVGMIRFSAMPPEDAELPTNDERLEMGDRLDDLVFQSICDLKPRPGKTTARRLNRAEYNNAVRDLFGIDLRPADQFPSDEVGGGFDNNADVLSLSPMLMDKYLIAADKITSAMIVDPDTLANLDQTFAGAALNVIGDTKTGSFGQRYIRPDGLFWVEVDVPVHGEYKIEVLGTPAKGEYGEVLSTMHEADGTLIAVLPHEAREDKNADDHEQVRMTLSPGKKRLFIRTTSVPSKERERLEKEDPDWKIGESKNERIASLDEASVQASRLPADASLEPDRDINEDEFRFRLGKIIVRGPSESSRTDLPPVQRLVIPQIPGRRGNDYVDVRPAAKKALQPILSKAFRCEISNDDLEPYLSLVDQMTARGDSFYDAMRTAISAVLVSPRFLFRVEVPETDEARELAASGKSVALSSNQLASRLSFFLWSSIPDEALLKAASRNELDSPTKRIEQVRRMLADQKSDSLGSQFARQWFGLGGLSGRDLKDMIAAGKDPNVSLNSNDLSRETEAMFLHLLRENRPVTELLTAQYTFVNAELARWYGLDRPKSDGIDDQTFVRVQGVNPSRPGILGHAGVLMLTAYPTRNSPVQRGKWILENLLGTPPPEPPPGIPALEETKTAGANATLREQLELHRADPGCASCHRVMDALGFGLEEFDHLGRLRPGDDPARKDANGELPDGRAFIGAQELADTIVGSETRKLADTAVRRMLAFAIGRELRPADRCFVEVMLDATQSDGYRIRDLLEQVVQSPPFLNHQAELPVAADAVAVHSDARPKENSL